MKYRSRYFYKKRNDCLGRDIKRIVADWSMDRKDRILYLVNLGRGWLPWNNHSSEIDLRPMKITYSGRGSISIFSLSFHKTLIPRIKISLFPNIPDIRYSNIALPIQRSNKIIFSNPRLNSTRYYLKTRVGEKKRRNKMIRWKRIARNFLSYKKEKKKERERKREKNHENISKVVTLCGPPSVHRYTSDCFA